MNLLVVNSEKFAATAADHIEAVVQSKAKVNICFPTGDTPKGVYLELERRVRHGMLSLKNVRGFGLDEWGELKDDNPIRCSSRIRNDLYNRVDIEEYYYVNPQAFDMAEECKEYERLIQTKGGLHLSMLGIGLNGHVGFNEPGSRVDSRTRVVKLDDTTKRVSEKYGWKQKQPIWGVTLGVGTLLESEKVLILANGRHKAQIVQKAIEDPVTPFVPVSLLRDHRNVTFLLDTEAAFLL